MQQSKPCRISKTAAQDLGSSTAELILGCCEVEDRRRVGNTKCMQLEADISNGSGRRASVETILANDRCLVGTTGAERKLNTTGSGPRDSGDNQCEAKAQYNRVRATKKLARGERH